MGEFLAGTAAQVAGGAALSAGSRAFRWFRLAGRYEARWIDLDNGQGSVSLTAPELADVERFMKSSSTRPLLSLLAITFLSPESGNRDDTLAVIQGAFVKAAEKWMVGSNESWSRAIDAVWRRLVELLADSLSTIDSATFDPEESEQFVRFVTTPLESRRTGSELVDYFDRVSGLASDLERLALAEGLFNTLWLRMRNRQPPPILTHTDAEVAADFAHLYIPRMIYSVDGREQSSETLMGNGAPYRIVLTGAPGAGKTTFVEHLSHAFSEAEEVPRVTVALRCRDFYREGWSSSITDYLSRTTRATFDVDVDTRSVRDLLILGRICIVVDGLDEIADIATRAELVQRIEGLCRTYPAISILVTSREVGYNRARLSDRLFEHHRILEFTPGQVGEYARRWFALVDRRDLVDAFMSESKTVEDLRQNPLLLSLLCILYRARGSIPRNRRDVYGKCADLLFVRWDAHRGILQPEDLPAYGSRLMQEIARWVYRSQAAQAGLEESVIAKVIAKYLAKIAGIEEDEARLRTDDFLEFCAGRAWLLAKIGTSDRGERIFGFTHRTFLEYFTAEAASRAAASPAAVAKEITSAYKADPTSVFPELLIQAYDNKEDGGGEAVFQKICEAKNVESELPIRLMDGVLLPKHTRRLAFNLLCQQWKEKRRFSLDTFVSLLNLNRDARSQFETEYLNSVPEAQELFMNGWASLELSDRARWFDDDWRNVVGQLAKSGRLLEEDSDSVTGSWALLNGNIRLNSNNISPSGMLVARGQFGLYLGAVWWILEQHLSGQNLSRRQNAILRQWLNHLEEGECIDTHTARIFADLMEERLAEIAFNVEARCRSELAKLALLGTFLVLAEAFREFPQFTVLVSAACNIQATRLVTARRRMIQDLDDSPVQTYIEEDWVPEKWPVWCREWSRAEYDLLFELRGRVWDPRRSEWVEEHELSDWVEELEAERHVSVLTDGLIGILGQAVEEDHGDDLLEYDPERDEPNFDPNREAAVDDEDSDR
ncbi:NACHT domain-containing protein [Kribbella karoonensis]|uniref:NACHT domain-containing protein n=1 Tax=Kribbella karoonensis TaxID=324851 RepID=A0ABN2EP32_9ACTN